MPCLRQHAHLSFKRPFVMSIETALRQLREQFEQIAADYFSPGFPGMLPHPVVPFDDFQIAISRDDPLRRQIVHPVQDRNVEQCLFGATVCHYN